MLELDTGDGAAFRRFCAEYSKDEHGTPTMDGGEWAIPGLRAAQEIIRAVIAALGSSQLDTWVRIRRAARDLQDRDAGIMDLRFLVVEAADLAHYYYQRDCAPKVPEAERVEATSGQMVSYLMHNLPRIRGEYAALTEDDLRSAMESSKDHLDLAARLSQRAGAFGPNNRREDFRKAATWWARTKATGKSLSGK